MKDRDSGQLSTRYRSLDIQTLLHCVGMQRYHLRYRLLIAASKIEYQGNAHLLRALKHHAISEAHIVCCQYAPKRIIHMAIGTGLIQDQVSVVEPV